MEHLKAQLLAVIALLLCGGPVYGQSAQDALVRLRARLSADQIYPRLECVALVAEGSEAGAVTVAIREKHDAHCGGDPDVSPVVDRYLVTSDTIKWYDALEDEFVPYSAKRRNR